MPPDATPLHLDTIGHGNHPLPRLLELLAAAGIETLADVRSQPYSRFAPQYNREPLRAAVTAAGLAYAYLGDALGGRPADPACWVEGPGGRTVDYDQVAAQRWFQEGLRRLLALAAGRRVALLCSEEDPARCHRHHLLARELVARGIAVTHLRGDGRSEPATFDPGPQLALF